MRLGKRRVQRRRKTGKTRLTNLHSVESSLNGVESSLLVVGDVSSNILDGELSGDDGGSGERKGGSRDGLDSVGISALVGST